MTDEARSRIEALERHTELGSGFQIASLDLELRGAGDLLGAEQSGNVAQRRLRSLLPDARRGRARAARRGGRARRRPRALLRRRGAPARGLRGRRRRAPLALQAPRERRPTRRTSRRSPPRWRTASARRPRRRAASSSSCRSRPSSGGCTRSAARPTRAVVTLHLRDDTPLDPAKITALIREDAQRLEAHARHAPLAPLRGGEQATASPTPRPPSPSLLRACGREVSATSALGSPRTAFSVQGVFWSSIGGKGVGYGARRFDVYSPFGFGSVIMSGMKGGDRGL